MREADCPMRFLVDENVPATIAFWIREIGNDAVIAGDLSPGAEDSYWLTLAEADQRVIGTADKDFGDLIFRDRLNSYGVVLLRLRDIPIGERLARVQEAWGVVEANPEGKFIVITPARVRVRNLS